MARNPVTASNLGAETIDFSTLQARAANSTDRVRVSYNGESIVVDRADGMKGADYLVESHGAGKGLPTFADVGKVTELPLAKPVAIATPAPQPEPAKFAPTPVRGKTVDLDGAIRSATDFYAAEDAGFAPKPSLFTRGTMVVELGVENARLSRLEHDAKPTCREYCADFVTKVRAENRKDVEVRVADLSMEPTGEVYDADTERNYSLSKNAFGGMLSRLGIGGAAYLEKCWPELRQHNVNAWLARIGEEESSKRREHAVEQAKLHPSRRSSFEEGSLKFRTRDNDRIPGQREVFAVVTPTYSPFDVDKIAEALAIAAPTDARGTVVYDGVRARFEVMFHTDIAPEKFVCGEFFKAGVIIETNDTGGGSLRGSAAASQNLCLNLIIIDEAKQDLFRIRHVGSVGEMARRFRMGFNAALGKINHFLKSWGYAIDENVVEEARKLDAEVPMKLEDALPGIFNGIIERELVPVRGRREVVVPKLMQMWSEDTSAAAGPTRAAVVNAFTRYAHKVNEDTFAEDEIQRAAGQLLYGRRQGQRPAPLPYVPFER